MIDLRAIARALRGNYNAGRNSASVPGPGHRSRQDRSLEVWIAADGRLAFHSYADDPRDVCEDYLRSFGFEPGAEHADARAAVRERQRLEQRARRSSDFMVLQAARLWHEAVDPTHTLAHRYLWSRGLVLPPEAAGRALRFHPRAWWNEQDTNGNSRKVYVPALLAKLSFIGAVTDYGRALHVIRLREDGSGHLGKRTYGSPTGLVCKLAPHAGVIEQRRLAVGEGVETMIGALAKCDAWPAWAFGPSGQLALFPTMHNVDRLDVYADFDGPGLAAAFACAKRWQDAGTEVFVHRRNRCGADFADGD